MEIHVADEYSAWQNPFLDSAFFEENPDLDFKIAPIQNAPLNWSFYIYRKVVEPQQTLAGTKRLFLIFQFLLSS